MPEGHTIHRAARAQSARLAGLPVRTTSPQGRFAEGAQALDGVVLERIDAHGKHLLYRFAEDLTLHIHLGLFGRFRVHEGPPPDPRPTTRLRMSAAGTTVDLVGPTVCALIDPPQREALLARLGPDPLRPDADPTTFLDRLSRSRALVGTLLMDQSVVAGVGNVFRAEALHVCGIHPSREGRSLTPAEGEALWATVRRMLEDGVRRGRIVTVDPATAGRPWSRIPRAERTHVYRRDTCLTCGGAVQRWTAAGRNVFACPVCQPLAG